MNFQDWISANGLTIQIASFYGALVVLALVEARVPLSLLPLNRKKRWKTNFLLPISSFIPIGFFKLSGFGVSIWAAKEGFGLLNRVALPVLVVPALTMLTRSFASWIFHVLMHKVPVLWRIHRIHHLDTKMDVSTTLRFHPVEFFFSLLVGMATIALFGLPVWALLAYEAFEATVRYFSHANLRLPEGLDRALRLFISTPGMHRLHHSISGREYNSNYGTILSLWDRLFGTFVSPEGKNLKGMLLGQEGTDSLKVQSFWWLLGSPFSSPLPAPQKKNESAKKSLSRKPFPL